MASDAIELEIFKSIFHSIAEEMGAALRRTAFSPNIKERRDYSCAVFDREGQVIAMGDHMPVHLGSMPLSVAASIESGPMHDGDVVILNDPFRGGTHLPDITLVAPVFVNAAKAAPHAKRGPDFYVASRAHHADVGGAYPGSMGLCREIYQEGVRIPPIKLLRAGSTNTEILALLLTNVRTPDEREGDLGAQIAACHTGAERLREISIRYGLARCTEAAAQLQRYSEELMRAFLQQVPPGEYSAEDFLDNDGITDAPIKINVKITVHTSKPGASRSHLVTVDFTGSDPQVQGSINAVAAITYSACFYVFRCLLTEDVPAAAGLMRPIQVIAPKGTIVNADESANWNELHGRFEMKRINHEEAYSLDGACTNWAEEFFSRMRRAEIGHHHHIAGAYLLRYAQETSWPGDNRRMSNGEQVNRLAGLAMKRGSSVDFTG